MRYVLLSVVLSIGSMIAAQRAAASDLELVCRGALEERSSDSRAKSNFNYDRSREIVAEVSIRELSQVAGPKANSDISSIFPGGLRNGMVFLGGGLGAYPAERSLSNCLIDDHQIFCSKETRAVGGEFFLKEGSGPERQISGVPDLFPSVPKPKGLRSTTVVDLRLDRRSAMLELKASDDVALHERTTEYEPFTVSVVHQARLTCEKVPDKPKF